jgi:hypothetical protein
MTTHKNKNGYTTSNVLVSKPHATAISVTEYKIKIQRVQQCTKQVQGKEITWKNCTK